MNTIRALKPHIGIFGETNVGKSRFINSLCDEQLSIVSEKRGTTTDPVSKHFELTGVGAVVLIDTAGLDDHENELGKQRVAKSEKVFNEIDLAIILITNESPLIKELLQKLEVKKIPVLLIQNKVDLTSSMTHLDLYYQQKILPYSAATHEFRHETLKAIALTLPKTSKESKSIIGDLVKHGDIVVLVTPIDPEAPAGRLIQPQVQTIRDLLDNDCITIVVKERELDLFFEKTKIIPDLVITDSQVFNKVAASVPNGVRLTSFSILFSRLKGDFNSFLFGTEAIDKLKNGDRVLIAESCSHHIGGDDIGRVKIPRWISNYTGKMLEFDVVSGKDMPDDLSNYKLIVQCGGCMQPEKAIKNRQERAHIQGVPTTNYGMCIAKCHGIFERAVKPLTSSGVR